MYTFLPIAPCTFTVNGKHFDVKINEPFKVQLAEAKIIASSSFRFRKYVRLITPLPKEEVTKTETVVPVSPKIEEVKQFNQEVSVTNEVETKVSEEAPTNDTVESENTTSKKRIRRKSSTSFE